MTRPTAFLENLHHVPAPGWTRAAYSVLRAGKVEAGSDYRIERASHPGQDVLFCLSGAGTVETLGQSAGIGAGQLAWIANERAHAHAADRRDPWTLLWFRLDGPDPAALRRRIFGDDFPRMDLAGGASPAPWFEQLFAAMRAAESGLDLALNQLVAEFLAILDRGRAGLRPDGLPPQLAALVAAMRGNLRLSWNATEIAAVTGLGPSQTRRLFRRHLRTSPRQWLIRERLAHAQAMMVQGRAPLAEVAELTGFSDVYHFSREFRRAVGAAPATWRRGELGAPRPR